MICAQHDTTFYHQHPEKLVVTLYQSLIRESSIKISENIEHLDSKNTALNYQSQTNGFTGIGFDYDVFGLSLSFKTVDRGDVKRKGISQNANVGFSFGTNKFAFEVNYRNYKGFYDSNTANYVDNFTNQSPFTKEPKMAINTLKIKALYYHNYQKYSYKSAYASTHRQLKSAISPIYALNFYYTSLMNDSTFIPYQLLDYYGDMKYLNKLDVVSCNLGGGLGANLVIKKLLFINGTFLIFGESQYRNYQRIGKDNLYSGFLSWGGVFRSSIGYNDEKFICYLSAGYEFSKWHQSIIDFNNQFLYAQFNVAYRINASKPKWYKYIERNWIYKLFVLN